MTPQSPGPTTAGLSIPELRAAISGRVVTPDDADYDEVRRVSLGSFDDRPAVIVRVANAADVAIALATSRATGLELAVRCGGASGARPRPGGRGPRVPCFHIKRPH